MALGVASGLYLNKLTKSYEQKIIVTPNFRSIDYLYNKIELINSKLDDNDEDFFKEIGISDYKYLDQINIEPIIDIYKFVENNKNPTNLELLKLIANDPAVNNIIKDQMTSKNFTNHLINFRTTKAFDRKDLIDPLIAYFNESEYYSEIQKIAKETALNKLAENDSIIIQIDKILAQYATSSTSSKGDQLLYISDNNQLNDLIEQKKNLIEQKTNLKIDLINESQIIKEVSVTTNALDFQQKYKSLKYILPILFVAAFILVKLFIAFYKSQIKKRNIS